MLIQKIRSDLVWTGKIIDWSSRAEKIFVWKRNEVMIKVIIETVIPSSLAIDYLKEMKQYLPTNSGSVI